MEILLVVAAVLLVLFLVALYVRDRRVRPAAGGSTYRYVLRWMLLMAALFLVLSIGDVAGIGWLVGLSALAMVAVGVTALRDLGFGLGDRRFAGRYRPVRGRNIYSRWDGYRGD